MGFNLPETPVTYQVVEGEIANAGIHPLYRSRVLDALGFVRGRSRGRPVTGLQVKRYRGHAGPTDILESFSMQCGGEVHEFRQNVSKPGHPWEHRIK